MSNYKPGMLGKLTLLAALLLIANELIYEIPSIGIGVNEFINPLPLTYLFFFAFSVLIISVLIKISKKNSDQLGYAFLIMTSVKMAASYFLASPVIALGQVGKTEKINFFVIFVLFLVMEAYCTAQLLNNKQ
ncbi:MAG: hypothetical protein EOO45_07580 [Flavobacterium sp.]|nr:MAG: hypothetical protein EOO45_07580 [Flavobacterium sp.]